MTFIHHYAAENIELWKKYIKPALGPKAFNQFVRATNNPSNLLVDSLLKPNVFTGPSRTDDFYFPLSHSTYARGRNHYLSQLLSNETGNRENDNAEWAAASYFANALRPTVPYQDEWGHEEEWEAPKERVCFAPHHIFTFEFDRNDVSFLAEQLSWLRSSNKKLDCRIGALYRALSLYSDFLGITVCYAGNKSLHIHIIFDTIFAVDHLKLSSLLNPRDGFVAHWYRLSDIVKETLKPTDGQAPDASLRFPEAYRRLPNGHREATNGHLLGIPAGTLVPQITLWEEWRKRTAAGSDVLFFEPEPFVVSPLASKKSIAKKVAASLSGALTEEEVAYCEAHLKAIYSDYPRFVSLDYENGHWIARFKNDENDRNPSSIMREDYRTILLAGAGAQDLAPEPLPFTLGVMIRFWLQQRERNLVSQGNISIEEIILEATGASPTDPLEEAFQRRVTDAASARREMRGFLLRAVRRNPLVLAKGPEGVGKSSGLFEIHHRLVRWLQKEGKSQTAIYAFADYASAEEKCTAFNAEQGKNGFVGVVIPSFTESYKRACAKLSVPPISNTEAAKQGFDSLWAAIKIMQPAVLDHFRKEHEAIWRQIGAAIPVFFTVHQVLHGWKSGSRTRLMWSKVFWEGNEQGSGHRHLCIEATKLGLAVHDELKVDSLVVMHPCEVIDWVATMIRAFPAEWQSARVSIAERYRAFERHRQNNSFPNINGREVEVTFEDARKIVEMIAAGYGTVVTANTGEYVNETDENDDAAEDRPDIYAARHGLTWGISARDWWEDAAHRVVALTTEVLPTRVACRADATWRLFNLDTPNVVRDAVDVFAVRGITSRNLAKTCAQWRESLEPDLFVISNKVRGLQDSMTHAAARGSNKLIGKNVLQTMTFMAPDEYEELQGLNAWMNRDDACLLRHIDEFNQTAGRNLGFRRNGDLKHYLLINPKLFAKINEKVLVNCRYDLRVHVTANQRAYIRAGRAN